MKAGEGIVQTFQTSDGNRRGALLARLASDPRQLTLVRQALPGLAEARLSALVQEIDETVLPRLLRLRSGARELARLTVSQRRLVDIEMPGRAPVPKEPDHLPHLFAARLLELADTTGELSIATARRPSHPNHAETACSVAALRQALAVAATRTAFDRLLPRIEAKSSARIVWSTSVAQSQFSGAPEWMVPLKLWAERFEAMNRQHPGSARVGLQGTQGVAIPFATGQLLVMAGLDKRGFAAVLPTAVGLDIIASWQID